MLIYHITDGRLKVTQVIKGFSSNVVQTFDKRMEDLPESHMAGVIKLSNGGDVYVIGGSYASAVYEGKIENRAGFNYIKWD